MTVSDPNIWPEAEGEAERHFQAYATSVVRMGADLHSLDLFGQPAQMPPEPGKVRVALGNLEAGGPFTFETTSLELVDDLVSVLQAERDRVAGLAVS